MHVLISDVDPRIRRIVNMLWTNGVTTFSSCQGGEGHAYPYPCVLFDGTLDEGRRVLILSSDHGYDVWELRHITPVGYKTERRPFWMIIYTMGALLL